MGILTKRTALVAGALLAASAVPAMAQDLSPINNFFTAIGTALTGTTGRAIGLVAICGLAILALGGRINVGAAISIGLGLVVLYGAATILSGF